MKSSVAKMRDSRHRDEIVQSPDFFFGSWVVSMLDFSGV